MSVKQKHYFKSMPRLFVAALFLVVAGLFLVSRQTAQAANPQLISFQGKVVNADGTNVTNGAYNFDFILWDHPTAGTNRWQELTKSITVTDGVFQTYLGSATALPDFNAYPTLYLAVRFNADAAGYMSPRVQLASVPYALNSDTLGGIAASGFANAGLSNLSGVAINTALLPGADNTIDLGSSAFSFRTLYADTSALTPLLDRASAGTLSIGTGGASAATTINVGSASVTSMSFTTDNNAANDFSFTGGATFSNGVTFSSTTIHNGLSTFNTDSDFTFAGTENINVTNTTGSNAVDLLALTLTNNDAGSAAQRGLVITNADSTSVTETGITIDNADTTTSSLTDAILITSSGVNNGVVDAIDVSDGNLTNALNVGANPITGAGYSVTSTASGLTLNSTSANLALTTTTSGDITLNPVGNVVFSDLITDANAVLYTTTAGVLTRVVETETGSQCLLSGAGASGIPVWGSCSGGGVAWDAIGDTAVNGAISMAESTQTLDWNTNDVTALGNDALTFTLTNDAATDVLTQKLITIANINTSGSSATEGLLVLDNRDTDEAVTTGLMITSAAGAITTAIDVSDSDIVTAISIGANDILTSGATISSAELNLLDAHDVALVDSNDAISIAIIGTGALNTGTITSGFGAIDNADTITGTVLNGTTGLNTGASAGTQRIDASGNLVNIGNLTATGALTIASTGASNDITINAVDQVIIDTASAVSIVLSDYITDANAVLYTSTTGVLTRVAETETGSLCLTSGSGASGVPVWGSCGGGGSTLQGAYDGGSAGDQIITFDGTQDSIVIRNPSSSGSDSTFTFKIEQLNTGASTTGLYVDNRGTGYTFRLDDISGDTTPLIVDADGRLGIGTTSIAGTTERLLQVGSATNRGNSATYGEIITQGTSQIQNITGIKDTFIYDTSLDSDGGRWIDWADTDKQSWATETLDDGPSDPCNISSDDRCYSANFPRKAILVVTGSALYIFDATNGTMWMKFNQNASGYALGVDTNNDPTSVTAANGVIYVGTNGSSAAGLYAIDFVNDRMWNYDDTDRSGADVNIGSRNSTVTYNSDNNTNFDIATVGTIAGWKTINDVSVSVIQNSATAVSTTQGPNNATTLVGLATDSGLTVINLSTQKVRQYSDNTDNDYNSVVVTRSARLYGLNSTTDALELWINIDVDNVATQVNGTPTKMIDETTAPRLSATTPVVNTGAPDALDVVANGSLADGGILATATVASNSDLIYVGTSLGLTEIHLANYTNATTFTGWSKFYTTSRQTAMMPGTIRRMHTMDNASGNVTNSAQTDIMAAKNTPTYGIEGVRGKAMSFNGTDEYLCSDSDSNGTCENDTSDNINTGGFTFTAWFKHSTTATGVDTLFARCYNTTPAAATGCIAAAMNASGQIVTTVDDDALWTIGASTNNDVTYTSTNSYADNQWHFYSLSKTNGNVAPVVLIDGQVISYATALNHTTLDNAQILGIGTDCSTGAACGTGGNFWDGAIDDFTFSACGSAACTTDGLLATSANAAAVARLLYNDARTTLNKKVINVTDATTATSTTIGDSGEAWIPQEFSGQIVTLTGGTGTGQTRRIISNTATTLTVTPAFTTTPDTTTDFKIDPEALVGASNNVTAIGVTKAVPIGESRMMCAGTNDSADGGAVTCFNHQAGPNLVADTYHSDANYLDDSGNGWTGTDYDDIQSIDITNRTMIIGSMAHTWLETQDVRLGNALDYLQGKFSDLRSQILTMGTSTLAGQIGLGVGLTGGADLAEYYASIEGLNTGDVVALEPNDVGSVKKSTVRYQKDLIGVVSTAPGVVLGPIQENSYPIALSGRVPVNVTTENGLLKTGDRVTSSSIPGYAMKAVNAGRVLGTVLDDLTEDKYVDCPEGTVENIVCGQVTVFVNLVDYTGESVDIAMNDAEENGMLWEGSFYGSFDDLAGLEAEMTDLQASARRAQLEKADKILRYLAGRETGDETSKVLADRVSANEINSVNVYAGDIFASSLTIDKIRANQIVGLEIFTDQIRSISERLAAEQTQPQEGDGTGEDVGDVTPGVPVEEPIESGIDMSNVTFEAATVSLDLNVMGTLAANGALVVNGDATFNGLVDFIGRATFNNDTGGFAVIHAGQQEAMVEFSKPYDLPPSVSLSIKNGKFVSYSYQEIKEESQGSPNFGKVTGIKILLEEPATSDVEFSWLVFSIKEAKTVDIQL